MAQDLRSFLDLVKRSRPEDFQIISRPVDPAYEITALVVKLEKEARRRPVVLFENVKGSAFPVLTNLHASRSRLATAINAAPEADAADLPARHGAPDPAARRRDRPGEGSRARAARTSISTTLPQIVHHQGDAGPYVTAAISFAKDPASETWNCAYNRLMLQGRDTHVDPPDARQAPVGVLQDRRGPGRAAAGGLRHRRPPGHRAGRPGHRLDRRGRARDHGRPARRAARAGEVRDLRRAGAGPRRAGAGGRDPAGRARGRGPVRRVHRLQPGRAPARGRALHGDHPPARRDVPGHHRRPPRSHAAVDDPDGGQPLPGGAGHGPLGQGGAGAGAVHLLRVDRAAAARPGQERDHGRASAPIST